MNNKKIFYALVLMILLCSSMPVQATPNLQDSPNPPAAPVKLIFVHHSTGGNWLADPNSDQPYGGLGIALRDNNYFVSATNYGWGPDAIGDRTDIVNWPEWFTGPDSATYLEALYRENGQNIGDFGRWSRLASDPGGPNEIIMFKSCFPNSDLYGSPDDPPAPEPNDEFTVGNAKAVYNDILTYFATRQDKLFVVITAPPLMEQETTPERALNAREFNYWLVYDWLAGYPYANVAVFDYFNVLTDPNNHHWWNGQEIERLQATDNNFAAYPSGDSHPNTEGHSKATAEFVPLLNVYYNRWKNAPVAAPAPTSTPAPEPSSTPVDAPTPTPAEEATPVDAPTPEDVESPKPAGVIDDWEGETWWGSSGDGDKSTVVSDLDTAVRHGGTASLRSEYQIVEGGWGDTSTGFDGAQDWSGGSGLSFWLHATEAGYPMRLVLYSGDPDAATPFEAEFVTDESHVSGWGEVVLPWDAFIRASWAEEAGLKQLDPARITGLSFSFTPGQGTLWVDDLSLFAGVIQPLPPPMATPAEKAAPTATSIAQPAAPTATQVPTPEPVESKKGLCGSAAALVGIVILVAWLRRR